MCCWSAPPCCCALPGLTCGWLGWRRAAGWLAACNLFVETDLARRMADSVLTELLRVDDPDWALPPEARAKVRDLIAEYLAARHAVAEFAAGFVTVGVGLALVQALTPSAITLGPLLAREFAQREAIEGFWLGPWAGAIWHGWYPAHASWGETIATTAVVMACFALVATFMGLVTDPVLQSLECTGVASVTSSTRWSASRWAIVMPARPARSLRRRLTDVVDVILLTMRMTR